MEAMAGAGRDRSGRTARPLAVRIGLSAAVVGLLAVTVGDDDEPPATTTTTRPELVGTAAELADLLELRQEQTYHARYEGASVDAASIVIETWQHADGRVRQDQILSTSAEGAHLVALDADDGPVRCTRLSEEEWSCRRATRDATAASDPLAAVRARLANDEVSASTEQVDGATARCFRLGEGSDRSELCVRPDSGIPVRITAGLTELRAVILEETVDPAVFEPPGPVT